MLFILSGCTQKKSLGIIWIEEKDGLDRKLEYVKSDVLLPKELSVTQQLVLVEINSGKHIVAQIQNYTKKQNNVYAGIVFPMTIVPNQQEAFEIYIETRKKVNEPLSKVHSLGYFEEESIVQNSFYIAKFNTLENGFKGQIKALVLKKFQDQVLKREHLSMHFSPNFARPDMEDYSYMENMLFPSQNPIVKGEYYVKIIREGIIENFTEIKVEGVYEFYKGLPYFIFSSTITILKDVELGLLRNDEMTMDSLFTHLMYQQKPKDTIANISLYSDELDILERNPIAADAPWLFFYHKEKEYAFGNIRLQYDNTNKKGFLSVVDKPYTKVSKGVNGGRYWNRILIQERNMMVFEGDIYREKNAYLVFKIDSLKPEKEIIYYEERLRHPLLVKVEQPSNHQIK